MARRKQPQDQQDVLADALIDGRITVSEFNTMAAEISDIEASMDPLGTANRRLSVTVDVDGTPALLADCLWVHYTPCGCAAALASGPAAGADLSGPQAMRLFTRTLADARRLLKAGHAVRLVSGSTASQALAQINCQPCGCPAAPVTNKKGAA